MRRSSASLLIAPKPDSIPLNPSSTIARDEQAHHNLTVFQHQLSFELTVFAEGHTPKIRSHREYVLSQYGMALASMRTAVAAGRQDVRTTLLTSLLIICMECLLGNFAMAGAQVANGVAVLREWRTRFLSAHLHPIGFTFPAPHIIEDSLEQIFGTLDLRTYWFTDKAPPCKSGRGMEDGIEVIANMPVRFQTYHEARVYLELILRSTQYWLLSFEPYFNTTESNENDPTEKIGMMKRRQAQDLNIMYHRRTSFEALFGTCSHMSAQWKALVLVAKANVLILKTVAAFDEMVYDNYTEDMVEILDLSEERGTGPPHFINLHCRVPAVRRRAVLFIKAQPPTQGLSNSLLMYRTIEWVIELEEKEMVDGVVPRYARIPSLKIEVDIPNREAKVVCKHHVMT
ncbi:uncharacterized protein PAC_18627 [Phialocephala subalpina]|uniref:Uncharacterized protein n=1 Tax=Phialocephala subalpina TaxID=576137 RepID=A0A1L7XUM0_9HELO|nr:uncharacterized protein PAC_18627 [Phialocephala subalpina]